LANHFGQEDITVCTDADKVKVWDHLRQCDWKAFQRLLTPADCKEAALCAGVRLGAGPLNLVMLVFLGLGAAWCRAKSFSAVLVTVLKLIQDSSDYPQSPIAKARRQGRKKSKRKKRHKHDPRGQDPTQLSEEAFVQARRKMPWSFWLSLIMVLARNFEAEHRASVRWRGFRLLALDGTGIRLPHWKRLASYFGVAKNGRSRRTQVRMLMLQFPQVRMPWRIALSPWTDDERKVAVGLLDQLQVNDLVLMDRGFWSFGLFCQIAGRQAYFATRQKARVCWRTVKRLGLNDRIVRHQPKDWRKSWKKQGLPESIDLRIIEYRIPGFRKTAVVTNLLDPNVISASDWVRMATHDEAGRVLAPGLYHRRWEIETTFRELKVTQGMEGSLRSRSPEGIRYEVANHVVLYLLTRWLMVEAAKKAGIDDPLRLSFKSAMEELGDMRETLLHAAPEYVERVLLPRLLERIASHLVPLRPGRHYSRPRDTKPKLKSKGRHQKPSKLKGKAKSGKHIGKN
jgi:Transposase DDE domain